MMTKVDMSENEKVKVDIKPKAKQYIDSKEIDSLTVKLVKKDGG